MGSSNRDRGFWKWYRTPLSALGFATSEERSREKPLCVKDGVELEVVVGWFMVSSTYH